MKLRATLVISLLALAACATPMRTRYYTLSDGLQPTASVPRTTAQYRVAIGPVSVPEVLDRPQIVLRIAPNRYSMSDTERWSEPLKHELPYLIAEEVGRRLPAARVAAYRQYGGQDADYRVLIDIMQFESVPGESITLEAAWSVRGSTGKRLREARSVYTEPVHVPGVAPLVAAHAKALIALARDIADAVNALARSKQ